jgi:hypothetical protein
VFDYVADAGHHPLVRSMEREGDGHDTDGGSVLVQRGEMRPKGTGWLLAPLMPLIVRRNLRDCGSRSSALSRAR